MNDLTRIELLEARTQIADVVYKYAQAIRNGDFASGVSLFAEDAMFEIRLAVPGQPNSATTRSKLVGHAAILVYLNEAFAAGGSVCPMISNLIIDVQGRKGSSNCMMTAMVWANGQNVIGEYHDTFGYDGVWRFASRTYTIFRARS